ncbi:MAG: hypothetical protein GTO45_37195 [Candidatus Aminicenantes bacterium]|nr:hypothetical protein [Candidatus Aminicenantes bacterium]NIM84303.1 hypothetical protein [Candidatus Aminicenantes bacterium]NIN23789.1 hypothetical protein [Candidatus Aminicenantes bacterium]NIN47505.1 hypothetical protein [Candidatus Aminicenantes bacterium]NIN90425.1 hypothetical protein [Candidatus Aminicenantes bacterium]
MDSQDSLNDQTNQNQQVDANQNDSPEEKPRRYKSRGFNEKIGEAELLPVRGHG